ncbi:protein translocase subunit SecF [Sinomonas humi]|uniref:Protein-export membrane protein SecF n=1 Tax=Sinomonas humi TaxID=1338436 RepID=A0A0B2AQE7_9MICC|nr:protein translocase subunit SecF [Sinomonas humi]KHL04172.1 preprotein translocase subunit SecF [Sinomonas humi]
MSTTTLARFGNDLYSGKRSYDFVGKKKLWFMIAGIAVLIAIVVPILRGGFNLSIDFRGGSQFTISAAKTNDTLPGENAVHAVVPGSAPQVTTVAGNTVQVQTDQLSEAQAQQLRDKLATAYGVNQNNVTSTFIGPTWGADVTNQAIIGFIVFVLLAAVLMALYFRTWKMSLSALSGMLVTIFITEGVYAISNFEISPSAIIGFLTILSYSLYDTVVVFDKIRENTADIKTSSRRTFAEEVNLAVNQTLVRSINTMMVAVLPVAAILFIGAGLLGAGTLRDLSLALFVGILVGTAATLFIAAPMYAALRQREPDLVKQAEKVAARRASAAAASTV